MPKGNADYFCQYTKGKGAVEHLSISVILYFKEYKGCCMRLKARTAAFYYFAAFKIRGMKFYFYSLFVRFPNRCYIVYRFAFSCLMNAEQVFC